ncbi:MAG: hypothetical protein IPK12_19495 [Gemmatimonadetes bacterium]|nr:hypothetical protein [Gemmatimonadota bacterium]
MGRYLNLEIAQAPRSWPLLALGRVAYSVLVYAYMDRAVIGIPHPSGAGPAFHLLFKGKKLRPRILRRLQEALAVSAFNVVWITGG